MRILVLANLDIGLYKFRKELINELIKQENDVYIALPKGEMIYSLKKMGCKFINVDVDRRGINPFTDIKLLRKYSYIIKKVSPDIVITYTIKPNIYGGIAALLRKTKYAINITGLGTAFQKENIVKFLVINLYRIALCKSKVVFFENSSNRDDFIKYRICSEKKMCVLNGAGVNTDEFSYIEYPNNTNFRFLFIGRVMKEKGVDELFFAVKQLAHKYSVVLDVVGPCEEAYEDKLNSYEKEGWLNYHGYQDDVKPFISGCDCFVLPSWHEGMANTNLECASCGRPIITSNIPGCKEAVLPQVSGLLVKKKDKYDLLNAMTKMINMPIDKRKQMGLEGRKHMIDKFEKNKVVSKTIERLLG